MMAECYAHEEEVQVLGCMLLDFRYCVEILQREGVGRTHFYNLSHQELFDLMMEMHERGEEVNTSTLLANLRTRRLREGRELSGEEAYFVAGLEGHVPSSISLESFLPALKDMHRRRLALDLSRRLVRVAADRLAPSETLVDDALASVQALQRSASPARFTIRSADELLKVDLPQNDNLLADRLLARGQSLTLLGAGGIGKSRLLLQLAACCISGRPFLDLRTFCSGTRWLVFQAENSPRRVVDDLKHLAAWLGDAWQMVGERLLIHTLEQTHDSFVQLDVPGVQREIAAAIEQHDPDVVCFDPLNCFGTGDLNSDADMRATCQAITRVCRESRADRAIVVLHHALTGRAGAARATGFDRSSFGRNSKLLQAWTRGQINIAPASPNDNSRLVISCGKCSNGEEFEPYAVRLNRETMIYEVDRDFSLAEWERQVSGQQQRNDPVDKLLALIHSPISRSQAVKLALDHGMSRTRAYEAINRAIKLKLLRVESDQLVPDQEEIA